jgi:mRNA interferase RelE/StbE
VANAVSFSGGSRFGTSRQTRDGSRCPILWLGENIDSIVPKRLTGQLSGLCKLREGDYRIIYQILREEKTITIHTIGHRKDIYRKT